MTIYETIYEYFLHYNLSLFHSYIVSFLTMLKNYSDPYYGKVLWKGALPCFIPDFLSSFSALSSQDHAFSYSESPKVEEDKDYTILKHLKGCKKS